MRISRRSGNSANSRLNRMSGFKAQRVGDVRERTYLVNDRVPGEFVACIVAAGERQRWRQSGMAWAILRGCVPVFN